MGTLETTNEINEMKELSNHASAAKMIRKHLKELGIKATVRASSGSMTSSVNVDVEEVLPATFTLIKEFCAQFEMGHFDGMTDMYEYSNIDDDRPQVKFVFVHHVYTDETKQAATDYIDAINGIEYNEKDRYVSMALNGSWGDFYESREYHARQTA